MLYQENDDDWGDRVTGSQLFSQFRGDRGDPVMKIDPGWSGMVQNGPKWSKMAVFFGVQKGKGGPGGRQNGHF